MAGCGHSFGEYSELLSCKQVANTECAVVALQAHWQPNSSNCCCAVQGLLEVCHELIERLEAHLTADKYYR